MGLSYGVQTLELYIKSMDRIIIKFSRILYHEYQTFLDLFVLLLLYVTLDDISVIFVTTHKCASG